VDEDAGYGKENQRVRDVDLEKDAEDLMNGKENYESVREELRI